MKKSYIATDKEAAVLHSGQQTAIIVPMKVQPVDCSHIHKRSDEICEWRNRPMELLVFDGIGAACKYCGNGVNYGGEYEIKSPYALHQPVYVRESWRKFYLVDENGYTQYDNQIIELVGENTEPINSYNADGFQEFNKDGSEKFIPHRSAATMPKSAARTWFVPVEVQVIRVQDITEKMARSLNIRAITKDGNTYKWGLCGDDGLPYGTGWKWDEFTNTLSEALAKYIAQKLGQKAWGENVFIWIYKIQKHTA